MTSKADIYALYVLRGRKDDYRLNDYKWDNLFNISPTGTLERLISNDLLELSDDPQLTLPNLLVSELKAILKNNGQKVSGRKSDLIQRILDNIELNNLKKDISFKVFELTNEGQQLLKNNASIPIIVKYYNSNSITFKNAELVGIKNNESDPKKIVDTILNYFYDKYLSSKKWDKLYNILIDKEVCGRSLDSTTEKIDTYLQLIYLSISGQSFNHNHESLIESLGYLSSVDDLKNYECSIPQYYIESIQRIESGTELTDKDILEKFKYIEKKFNSIESIFDDDEMSNILSFSLEGDLEEEIDSIYQAKFNKIKSISKKDKNDYVNVIIDTNAIMNAEIDKQSKESVEKNVVKPNNETSDKNKHKSIWNRLSSIFKD